jgi:putative membrane protein
MAAFELTASKSPNARDMPRAVRPMIVATGLAVALGAWAAVTNWHGLAGVSAWPALRLLPLLVLLHLSQLLLAGVAWRALLPVPRPPACLLWRLRTVREGVDSLLPVAQMGGEVIGAGLLARYIPAATVAASVIVDLAVELLTQIAFLGAGLLALVALSGRAPAARWLILAGAALAVLAGLVLAPRLGVLRGTEALLRGIARRAPALVAGASLDGLHEATLAIWRRHTCLAFGIALHVPAWALGSIETWLVLRALGYPVSPAQALVVESLGMAGRSAGFAIPAAIGAQEGGFVLAAAAIGVAAAPAIALSLVKRLREVLVGLIGLGLWRLEASR